MARKCTICGGMTERRGLNEPKDYNVVCEICSKKCIKCGKVQVYANGNKICSDCVEKDNPKPKSRVMIIDNLKYNGTEMSESHYKDLHSRCVDDDGNALRGDAGLKYMQSKGNSYAGRLREYNK